MRLLKNKIPTQNVVKLENIAVEITVNHNKRIKILLISVKNQPENPF